MSGNLLLYPAEATHDHTEDVSFCCFFCIYVLYVMQVIRLN